MCCLKPIAASSSSSSSSSSSLHEAVKCSRRLVVQSPSMTCDPQTRPKKTTNSNTESDESWEEC
jgi:hypothetical protein